jgi:two-component system sensor kinase FixL
MRIGQKLVLGFIGIASLVGIIGAIAIKYNTDIVFGVDQILLGNSNEAKAATEITYHIQKIQTNINKLLFGRIDEEPEQKKHTKEIIEGSVSKLQQFTLLWEDAIKLKIELSGEKKETEEELKTFKNLKTKIDGFIPLMNEAVALQEKQGSEAARLFFENKVEPLLLETQKTAENLEKSTSEKVITQTEWIRNAISDSTGIIIISTIISFLAVIVVRHFIWRTISNPIAKLKDAADKIGKGELETKIHINSNDEIGALAQSFNDMTCKLKEARTSLEEKVGERTDELSAINANLQKEIGGHSSAQEKLQQHIRHLDCFYGLSKLIEQPEISLEEIFQETVHLIRNAFQHPDSTCVRITFEGINYKTDNFRKSELSQYAKIKVYGDEVGAVEVYYLGEKTENGKSPFLKEECDLLDAIAEHLGRIAARTQTTEKLELLRNLIDRSNDCIFIMEPKWGRLLDTNDRACASLGYAREELLNMAFKNIEQSIPDDSSWHEQIEELKLKEDLVIQGRHRRKDGTTFFTETSLKLVSQKTEDFIIAIARDVTERKQAEEALRESEERYKNLFKANIDGILIADVTTKKFRYANPAICRMLGYSEEELTRMSVADIHPKESLEQVSAEFEAQVSGAKTTAEDLPCVRKDGQVISVSINAGMVTINQTEYLLGVFRDITERKKAEQRQAQLIQELERTNQEVENVNQELKDFAYIVSHDLKAPLRGIKTLVDWITADCADKLNGDSRQQINLLTSRVSRMHNLIDGILQYSRVGRVKEEKVVVNLNELAAEAIDMVAPPENITITIENELPTIVFEPTRIMQVFQNLLSNAVKYMDKPKGQIKVNCVEEDGFWKFSIADNGPGIEEKNFERIFKIFQTLTPRDEFESTGIGLTITKKIVELYNGKIWVESKPGHGSTFFFTLPKQEMGVKNAKLEAIITG